MSATMPKEEDLSVKTVLAASQECLDAFTEVEKLEADEGYNCQACRRRGVQATKKLTLYRCPPVLAIHLKRFSANTGMFSRFSALSKVSSILIGAAHADMLHTQQMCIAPVLSTSK